MALGLGSIAFVGFNADGADNLAFVALEDIIAGTVINFTDKEWNGTAFNSGESTWTWTATSDVAAGTVVTMDGLAAGQTATSNLGTVAFSDETQRDIAISNETVYAYVGDAADPAFLSAISNDAFNATNGLLTNTGLVPGETAISLTNIDPDADIAIYAGIRGAFSFEALRPLINNPANWISQDTSALNDDDGTAPDVPFSTEPFVGDPDLQTVGFAAGSLTVSQAEGDSEETVFTFTVERSGGTAGAVNFSGTIEVKGTTRADDFAGPLSFTGTIGDGQTSGTVTIRVSGDTVFEPDNNFTLTLRSASNGSVGTVVGEQDVATGTIVNDDVAPLSIAFVGYSADGADNLAFLAVSDIPEGTVIHFTNAEWMGSNFQNTLSGAATWSWTAGADIAAGSVITIDDLATGSVTSNLGTVAILSAAPPNFPDSSFEMVYAYLGAPDEPTSFLTAISNNSIFGWNSATLEGTGLTIGVNAIALGTTTSDTFEVAYYNGPRTGQTSYEDYLPFIYDTANWAKQESFSVDNSTDGIFPDVPFPALPFSADPTVQVVQFAASSMSVTQPEGTGADTVFVFTVERTNGTEGDLTFTVRVPVAPYSDSANATDFGGTLPTITGTIPDGQSSTTVTIVVTGDTFFELNERFHLVLESASNPDASSVVIGNNSAVIGTITDNDTQPTRVLAGEEHSATIRLTGDTHFVIEEGGSTRGITWRGDADIVIDNGGETGSITSAGGSGGTITINNLATGIIRGVVSAEDAGQTNYTLNNAGRIELAGDRLDLRDPADEGATVVVNNLAGGVIAQTDAAEDIMRPGANTVVNNYGTIMHAPGTVGGSSDGLDYQGDPGVVNNYEGGLIEASRHAVTGDAPVQVLNEGTMIGRNGSAVNIDSNGSEAERVFITNRGTMEGHSANLADSDGDAVDIDGLLTLENYGRIAGMGHNGYHDGEPNVSEGLAIGGGTITNHEGGEIYGYGRAIQVDNSSNANALGKTTIVNHGLIRGDGNVPTDVTPEEVEIFRGRIIGGEAINLLGDYADEIVNTGEIIGGVKLGGGNDLLTNSGIMTATGGSAIDTGEGDDTVTLEEDAEVNGAILLGAGNDTLTAVYGDLEVDGGDGDDVITTGEGDDSVTGGAGNDQIDGGEGDDELDGEEGDDVLKGNVGDDLLIGGAGNDLLNGGEDDDELDGGEGVDTADYSDDESGVTVDLSEGEAFGDDAGSDTLADVENVTGGIGDDTLIGNEVANLLDGGEGNDSFVAGAGDTVIGGAGDDEVEASAEDGGPASVDGGEGDDIVRLTAGSPATIAGLGTSTGVETLLVEEGTWSIADGAVNVSDITIKDGATVTSGIVLDRSGHLVIEAGGKLVVAGDAITWQGAMENDEAISGDFVIDNAGLIEADGRILNTATPGRGNFTFNNLEGGVVRGSFDPRQEVRPDSVITFNNAGLIEDENRIFDLKELVKDGAQAIINNLEGGVIQQVGGDGEEDVMLLDDNTVVNNWGTIKSLEGSVGGGDALNFDSGRNSTVHNYAGGLIEGSRHAVTGKQDFTIVNDGTMIGRNGSAVNFDTNENELVTVTNRGVMEGRSAELDDSDGDAIDVDGKLLLHNYGRISGLGAEGYHDGEPNVSEGIAIGGGEIHNYAGGEIYGYGRGIQVDNSSNESALGSTIIVNEGLVQGDGHGPEGVAPEDAALFDLRGNEAINLLGDYADSLTNSGQIVGGVSLGGGDDVVTNSGSMTATGGSAIDLGAGDDTLNVQTGSAIVGGILGGDGDDTVNLIGATAAATGTFGATSGIENLVVQEGSWSVADSDYSSVMIEDGATVTSAVALNNDDRLSVETGGKLIVGTAITWSGGGDAVVENAGLIEASSRVFNTTAGATGSFTFSNLAGGTVRGQFSPQQRAHADAQITINNAGILENSGRVIDLQNLVADGAQATINNLAGGIIRQTGSDTDVIRPGQNTVVNNWGTITTVPGFVGGGDLIDFQSSTGGKVNNHAGGWMEGSRHVVTGDNAVTVVNEGTMIGRNGSAVNIDSGGSEAEKVFVTNRGTMEGRSAELSDSDGDAVDVDGLAQILNYGRIAGMGAEGYHDGEPNVSEAIAIGGGSVVNNADGEIYGYGRAIQVDNSSNSNALGATTIVNDGLIQGDGHGPEGVDPEDAALFDLRGNEAINLVGDYEDFVGNNASGRIVGGISMGGGRDTLNNSGSIVATGGSAINMGAGNDQVNLYVGSTVVGTILLGAGDDVANSTSAGAYVIDGGDGNDSIAMYYTLFGGDDTLTGGAGDDHISGGLGNDLIDGGLDNDTLYGEDGNDTIDGGEGNDRIDGGAGNDTVRAGAGDDVILAGLGNDTIDGGDGFDILDLSGLTGPVSLDMAAGRVSGAGIGFDTFTNIEHVQFGSGDDQLSGGSGDDVFDGGAGNDRLTGAAGDDQLSGGEGNDVVDGGSGDDIVDGGAGDDQLKAGSGDDEVDGGEGDDVIDAGSGDDLIAAGAGNDDIKAGSGDDRIEGGAGDDEMSAGSGHDTFVFAAGFGHDTITDFATSGSSSDVLEFSSDIFANFADAIAAADQVGDHLVFTIDANTTLTLEDTCLASLGADDFRFV